MDLGLEKTRVLVTGASGGIGLATVQSFLEQGALVVAQYNTNKATLTSLQEEYPQQLLVLQADLTKEDQVYNLFDQVEKEENFGIVQVLVVNHAIYNSVPVPIADMQLEQWTTTITANLTSSFLVARSYLSKLRGIGGSGENSAIVLVESTAGKFGMVIFNVLRKKSSPYVAIWTLGEAGHGDYAATKSAMMYGLTMTLKNEIVKIAPLGRVNCVAPGWVLTPMAKKSLENPDIAYSALATTPLKKVAKPEDVASQIVLLSSYKVSGHVTGQVIMIEGGMEGRLLNSRTDLEKAE